MGTYYNDSNYCANLDVDSALLGKLLKQLCKNVNKSGDEDHSPDNLKNDATIIVGKKPIVCDPMSKTNASSQMLIIMLNKRTKNVLRDYTFLMSQKLMDIFD